ncbi:MAG: acyltransferase family protein [Ruminococcus sp.]|nr:acyltransferase family protein [Ruminococcus sp.]
MGKKLGNNNNPIDLRFKVLSAIGIIIIVSGHCYHGALDLAYDWFPTYSFNLSLFVFISGYFYKDKYEDNVLKYIWKRVKRLLIPAYLWNIVYGLFVLIMSNFGYTIGAKVDAYNLFIMPFIDGEGFAYNLGSWFVYPLFLVCVFNILFRKLLKLIHLNNEYLILVVYLFIGILGIQMSIDNAQSGIKGVLLLLFRTMLFLPCYEFGMFYKTKLEKHDNLNSIAYFAIIFAVQLILLTFCDNLEFTPSKCTKFLNGCFVPYITSITGIAFWLRISKLITPIIKNQKLLRLISDNTYSIMIHQMLGFMVVKWVFYLISTATPLLSDFNVESMKSNIWYYYLPNGLTQWSLLYLVAGIFIPILISLGTNKVFYYASKVKYKLK